MKRVLFIMCMVFVGATMLRGQVRISGSVSEAGGIRMLGNAIVTVKNEQGRIVSFTESDNKGSFSLTVGRETALKGTLQVSLMSYKKKEIPLNGGESQYYEIELEPTSIRIKEVTVKARRMNKEGDTLTYFVENFAQTQDRSIGDVLKKMPGIQVSNTGQIQYNGININKFYIEGQDLLEGRYGIATQGISYQDISRVEVLENHQPIKVLQDNEYSEQAAINLRLKQKSKAHLITRESGAIGYADKGKVRWEADLFGMLFNKRIQSITTYQSNNIGNELSYNIRNYYGNGGTETNSYISGLFSHTNNLKEQRTLFNNTHLLSNNQLWSIGKEVELKTQIDYYRDCSEVEKYVRTQYFLPDSIQVYQEKNQAERRKHLLAGAVVIEANKTKMYLKHLLNVSLSWNDTKSLTIGSYPNEQNYSVPRTYLSSNLNWIQRFGKHMVSFAATNRLNTGKEDLEVTKTVEDIWQKLETRTFYTHEAASYKFVHADLSLSLLGGFNGLFRKFIGQHSRYLMTYLKPQVEYMFKNGNIRFTVPMRYYHYDFDDLLPREHDLQLSPTLNLAWKFTSDWRVALSGSLAEQPFELEQLYDGYIFSNYRTQRRGVPSYATGERKTISGMLSYGDAFDETFGNLNIIRTWQRSPFTTTMSYQAPYMMYGYKEQPITSQSWLLMGNISQGIDPLKGIVSFAGNYMHTRTQQIADAENIRYTSTFANLMIDLNSEITHWWSIYYKLECGISTLESKLTDKTSTYNWQHTLQAYFFPMPKWQLTLSGEYYHNEIEDGRYKDMVLLDAKLVYQAKRWELTATLNNLLNRHEYAYTTYNDLSSIHCSQQIRGREFLVGITLKL